MKRSARLRKALRACLLLAALAAAAGMTSDRTAAQQPAPGQLKIFFSTNPDQPTDPKAGLELRPNLEQAFFLYVENTGEKPADFTVELRAGGVPVEGGSLNVKKIEGGKTERIDFRKPGVEKPTTGGKGPELGELPGPLYVRLLDEKKNVVAETAVSLGRPSQHVQVAAQGIKYYPDERRLTATLEAKRGFFGPRARVELVLDADRIPALLPDQSRKGSFGGYLNGPGDKVTLEAKDLMIGDGDNRNGVITITVDGYPRAFLYRGTFPRSGGTPVDFAPIGDPALRLTASPAAVPGAPSRVGMEADNLPPNVVVQLGLFRAKDSEEVEGLLFERTTARRERIFFHPAGPSGALLFKTVVEDWVPELDTAAILGERELRLRLVERDADRKLVMEEGKVKTTPVFDSGAPIKIDDKGNIEKKPAITRSLILDAARPKNIRFLLPMPADQPQALPRGAPLVVRVTAEPPESGIAQVHFYSGRPEKDGKPPASAVVVPGQAGEKNTWEAKVPVPNERGVKVDVTVQLVSGAGQTATETIAVQLIDPADQAKGGATIAGTVVEGDRPQPGLTVTLVDPQGVTRYTVKSGPGGTYLFKDVAPGSYRVIATKTGSNTRGQASVQVQEGDKKNDVEIRLQR